MNHSKGKAKLHSNMSQSYTHEVQQATTESAIKAKVKEEDSEYQPPKPVNTEVEYSHESHIPLQTTNAGKPRKKTPSRKTVANLEAQVNEASRDCSSKTPIKRKTNKGAAAHNSVETTAVDPIIEQWYTDPYNRYNSEGPAGIELRRHVLTTALRNRGTLWYDFVRLPLTRTGFGGGRIINIVNWLLRCKGQHKTYDDLVGANRKRRGRSARRHKSKRARNTDNQKKTPDSQPPKFPTLLDTISGDGQEDTNTVPSNSPNKGASAYPSPVSMQALTDDDTPNNRDSNPNTNPSTRANSIFEDNSDLNLSFNLDTNPDTDTENEHNPDDTEQHSYPFTSPTEHEAVMQQLKNEITGTRPSFSSHHAPGTQARQDDYDDWRLSDLKRTQSFWNIIYGDDLDDYQHKEEEEEEGGGGEQNVVKFTYFRDPGGVPRPDVEYRTQGLKPLKRVVCKGTGGREVLTEDEAFGLYVPVEGERLS